MSYDFFDRRRAERFAQLLDEANGGRRHHVRSPVDDELAELVAVGHQRAPRRPVRRRRSTPSSGSACGRCWSPPPSGRASAPSATARPRSTSRRSGPLPGGQPGRRRRAPDPRPRRDLVGVAAGAIAVSGMSAASENAMPGDALYGVKRSTERAQLALASSDLTRGQLSLDFARTRLAEAGALGGEPTASAGCSTTWTPTPGRASGCSPRRRSQRARPGRPGRDRRVRRATSARSVSLLDGRADRRRAGAGRRSLDLLTAVEQRGRRAARIAEVRARRVAAPRRDRAAAGRLRDRRCRHDRLRPGRTPAQEQARYARRSPTGPQPAAGDSTTSTPGRGPTAAPRPHPRRPSRPTRRDRRRRRPGRRHRRAARRPARLGDSHHRPGALPCRCDGARDASIAENLGRGGYPR